MPPLSPIERLNPTRLSIKWKVFVPVAGILLAAFIGYAFLGLQASETQLLDKTARSSAVLSAMIERVIRPAALQNDEGTLKRLLSDLSGLPDLRGLRILHPDGTLWEGRGGNLEGVRERTAPLREKALTSSYGIAEELGDGWNYHIVRVIRRSDRQPTENPIGFLEMDLSVADTKQKIESGRFQLAMIGIVALCVLAGALIVVIDALVGTPLSELTDAMQQVEGGNLQARAQIRSGDELEQLGHSFNRMVEEIDSKNHQLIEAGQQLLKSEKLASIGLLAAGVAHEINNPVATISMSAEGLLETEASPERRKFLKAIVEESERIGTIVRNLLGFEKGGHTAYEPFSLNSIVNEAVEDLEREAERAGIAISTRLRLPDDLILGQGEQLRQAFVNIMDNALRAMSHGGRLDIVGESEDGIARLHFCDTGPGIPEEHQKHIFDPFFTTREVGEGFGLGLAVCYEIIKRHNGDITVDSGPNGTTFTLELPLLEKEREKERRGEPILTDTPGG